MTNDPRVAAEHKRENRSDRYGRHRRQVRPAGIVFFWQGFTNRAEAQIRADSDQRQFAAAVQDSLAMATMLSTQAEKILALLFLIVASAV